MTRGGGTEIGTELIGMSLTGPNVPLATANATQDYRLNLMAHSGETVMLGTADECVQNLKVKEETCFTGQPCF